jgi:hypothetical protein
MNLSPTALRPRRLTSHFATLGTIATLACAAQTLSGCASAPPNAEQVRESEPVVFASSTRSPQAIARCMSGRVDGLVEKTQGGTTVLTLGRGTDHYAWLITLTPSGTGAVIKAQKSSDDDLIPEPEMRFAIARCTA